MPDRASASSNDVPPKQASPEEMSAGSASGLDIADVPAVEVVLTVAIHLLTASAIACGLATNDDSSPRGGRSGRGTGSNQRFGRIGHRKRSGSRLHARRPAARRAHRRAASLPGGFVDSRSSRRRSRGTMDGTDHVIASLCPRRITVHESITACY